MTPHSGRSNPLRDIGRGEVRRFGIGEVRFRGHLELQDVDGAVRPVRLPSWCSTRYPPAAAVFGAQVIRPSGVRISFRTTATRVSLRVRATRLSYPGVLAEQNGFAICVDGAERDFAPTPVDAVEFLAPDGKTSTVEAIRSFSVVAFDHLPTGDKAVDIWFPQMMVVDLYDVDANAPLVASTLSERDVWIHYGSSISHGGDVERPTATWPVLTAQQADLQLINLGFAGQCHLDPFVADAIADVAADVISLELGVNVVGGQTLDQRTFVPVVHGFLDRIRRGHPKSRVVVVSSLLWPGNEAIAGPGVIDVTPAGPWFRLGGTEADVAQGALSMQVTRALLAAVVRSRADDERIEYVDGTTLYGPVDATRWPLRDNLHPDEALHREVAQRFVARVFP